MTAPVDEESEIESLRNFNSAIVRDLHANIRAQKTRVNNLKRELKMERKKLE